MTQETILFGSHGPPRGRILWGTVAALVSAFLVWQGIAWYQLRMLLSQHPSLERTPLQERQTQLETQGSRDRSEPRQESLKNQFEFLTLANWSRGRYPLRIHGLGVVDPNAYVTPTGNAKADELDAFCLDFLLEVSPNELRETIRMLQAPSDRDLQPTQYATLYSSIHYYLFVGMRELCRTSDEARIDHVLGLNFEASRALKEYCAEQQIQDADERNLIRFAAAILQSGKMNQERLERFTQELLPKPDYRLYCASLRQQDAQAFFDELKWVSNQQPRVSWLQALPSHRFHQWKTKTRSMDSIQSELLDALEHGEIFSKEVALHRSHSILSHFPWLLQAVSHWENERRLILSALAVQDFRLRTGEWPKSIENAVAANPVFHGLPNYSLDGISMIEYDVRDDHAVISFGPAPDQAPEVTADHFLFYYSPLLGVTCR